MPTDGKDTTPTPPRTPFTVALTELNQGSVTDEATEGLAEVVAAVRRTGKKGTLTVVLEVAPVKKSDGQQVLVTADVTVKAPREDRTPSFYFALPSGELTRDLQRDPDLFTNAAAERLKEI